MSSKRRDKQEKENRSRARKDKDSEKQPSGGTIIAIIIFLSSLVIGGLCLR